MANKTSNPAATLEDAKVEGVTTIQADSEAFTIHNAILTTILSAPSLTKAEKNDYQHYNYVSIDAYYEAIPKLAAKNGLFWRMTESDWNFLPDIGKDGAIKVTYEFDMMHKSGACIEGYSRFTIIHPIQGAQTAGSAASYAEKLMMRITFKIVTGEKDADDTNQDLTKKSKVVRHAVTNGVSKTPSIEAQADTVESLSEAGLPILKNPPPDWSTVEKIFTVYVPRCANRSELISFHRDNTEVLEQLEKIDPEARRRVADCFTMKANAFKQIDMKA